MCFLKLYCYNLLLIPNWVKFQGLVKMFYSMKYLLAEVHRATFLPWYENKWVVVDSLSKAFQNRAIENTMECNRMRL